VADEAFEASMREWLKELPPLAELEELVMGSLTDEERELVAAMDLAAEPTAEDLGAYGPEFVERLLNRLFDHGRIRKKPSPHLSTASPEFTAVPSGAEYIALVEMLAEAEIDALVRGESARELGKKRVELLESAADVFIAAAATVRASGDD
jgi:hypothetical protein